MFFKWLFTGRCGKCDQMMQEREEEHADEYASWTDRIYECPNGHRLVQTGRTSEFR